MSFNSERDVEGPQRSAARSAEWCAERSAEVCREAHRGPQRSTEAPRASSKGPPNHKTRHPEAKK